MKAYLYIFQASLAKEMSYRVNFLFTYLLHITKLLIFLTVWSVIFAENQIIHNYTWERIATYYALMMIISLLCSPSHMFELQPLIRKGTLSSLLIKPINIEANLFAKFFAAKLPNFVILTTLTLLVYFFLNITLEISITSGGVLMVILAFFLTFYFGLFMSALAFWLIEMWPIRRLFQASMALFGGLIAPLDLLPKYLQIISMYTPFPYFAYINVKALQGAIPQNELVSHFYIALAWTVAFAIGFKILWRLGLKRYEAVNL